MANIIYFIVALLFVGGTGFLAFLCMRKFNGNMGSNMRYENSWLRPLF